MYKATAVYIFRQIKQEFVTIFKPNYYSNNTQTTIKYGLAKSFMIMKISKKRDFNNGSFHIISTTFRHDPLGFSRNLVLLNPSWSYDSITSFSLIPCMVSFKTLIAFSTIFPTTCCLTIYNFVIFCPISRLKTSN